MNSLETKLCSMKSFEAIKFVLNGIELHDLQCIDVMKMILSKKSIVSYDTGTGKTLLAAAVMRLLWNEDSTRKFIMFVKSNQLTQTPKKIEAATGRKVVASNGVEKNLVRTFTTGGFDAPVVMLTHSCLRNDSVMRILFAKRNEFCGVFIDEAHELNNKDFAQSADMLSGMIGQFEYAWALTATPIVTNAGQMSKLASIFKPSVYKDAKKLARNLEYGRFSIAEDPLFFINRTGKELGRNSSYSGHILWVDAMGHQKENVGGNALMLLCKGDGAEWQVEALVNLVQAYEGKRGLIYIHQHSVREWVLPFLESAGIRVGCINGKTKTVDDADVMYRFNEEKSLDVVITSCTEAIDLDCDYVIFYEFTVLLKQMIGRADRGLKGKNVDVWYVITRGSMEPLYFKRTIVDRSELIKSVLGKDYHELECIAEDLEREVEDIC